MADDVVMKQRQARFLTWHNSNGDLHLRTDGPVMFIAKTNLALIAQAKELRRGDQVTALGRDEFSRTLSTHVFVIDSLSRV